MAHSLGNMLVSAAIQDFGMPYEKYFMLNAAVAPEAAGTIQTDDVYTTTGDPLCAADLTGLTCGGVDIDPSDYLGSGNAPGVLAFEARKTHGRPTLVFVHGCDVADWWARAAA